MEKILVLDFGGQYDQLIARRIRSAGVYAEIEPYYSLSLSGLKARGYSGIVFTGGPDSVYEPGAPSFDPEILGAGIPVLGICYGAQLMAFLAGGEVGPAESGSEYGRAELRLCGGEAGAESGSAPGADGGGPACTLFEGVPAESVCWMSHTDCVRELPEGFVRAASTPGCLNAAFYDPSRSLYALQFHPEVTHTEFGQRMLVNFVYSVCGCSGGWTAGDIAASTVSRLREELAGKRVLLALSGGVDSSVAAEMLRRAIGDRLVCVFVDHGLLRKGEADLVERAFRPRLGGGLIRVDASERFLGRLAGVADPEEKRKIIGEEFIRVFEEEAGKLGHIDALAQGTIYPDIVESGKGGAAVIKSHHNVGGLPERMGFSEIVEPLRMLFKDEVRQAGLELGLPEELVMRQPFPGPGLAVRITGEITREKVRLLQEADAIFREETDAFLRTEGGFRADQYFAVLTDTRSVGVMGDHRTFGYTLALRCVTTDDFMTAEFTRLPWDLLERVSGRVTGEVPGISRVVYDVSSKPPATVEWL
ncbi:MAG: glutamine-hydrolyzing GMP synthase [Firmicutes bacterium]|nr:glutamine-hydrolyzing GMP synthase [Bacillota bacterium]